MTSPFWKAHEKLSWVAKVKLYLASAVFWVIVINLGEGPNYSSNSEDCLLLIIIIIIIFVTDFSRAYFSYSLAFIATKIHRNVGTIATWVAMTFVTLDMIESELFPKNKILQKTQHSVNIYSFQIFFFLFCSRVQGKAHGRHSSRPINHRFQTRGNRKWRFSRKCKISYILKNYLTYMKSDDFCGLSVKK